MNYLASLNLLLNAAATFYLVGVIWVVQRVHYPLFAAVGDESFRDYQSQHLSRITPVVAAPMLIEAATAVILIATLPPSAPPLAAWLGLGLLAVVWLSTWGLQVPRHDELVAGFDASAHARLVATNWIRTAAWSLRGLLLIWILFRVLSGVDA